MVSLNYVFSNSILEVGFCEGVQVDKLIQDLKVEHCNHTQKKKLLVVQHYVSSFSDITRCGWNQNNSWLTQLSGVIQTTCFVTNKQISYIYITWMYEWGSCIKSPQRKNTKYPLTNLPLKPIVSGFLMLLKWFIRVFSLLVCKVLRRHHQILDATWNPVNATNLISSILPVANVR